MDEAHTTCSVLITPGSRACGSWSRTQDSSVTEDLRLTSSSTRHVLLNRRSYWSRKEPTSDKQPTTFFAHTARNGISTEYWPLRPTIILSGILLRLAGTSRSTSQVAHIGDHPIPSTTLYSYLSPWPSSSRSPVEKLDVLQLYRDRGAVLFPLSPSHARRRGDSFARLADGQSRQQQPNKPDFNLGRLQVVPIDRSTRHLTTSEPGRQRLSSQSI